MHYKSAVLGCGPRSNGHAKAYEQITRSRPVACCDLDATRLQAYGEEFGIAARYTDLDDMLDERKPDVVHVVTPPTLRVGLMTRLAEAGVPGVIVEKPICIGADDYKALRELAQTSRTKFAVNHQLRYHPRVLDLLAWVQGGPHRPGAVSGCVGDASHVRPGGARARPALCLCGLPEVETVFGASSGYDDINGTHPSPRTAESLITFRERDAGRAAGRRRRADARSGPRPTGGTSGSRSMAPTGSSSGGCRAGPGPCRTARWRAAATAMRTRMCWGRRD